jgi:hypothetical protein
MYQFSSALGSKVQRDDENKTKQKRKRSENRYISWASIYSFIYCPTFYLMPAFYFNRIREKKTNFEEERDQILRRVGK